MTRFKGGLFVPKKQAQQNSQWQKISRESLVWAVFVNFCVVELSGLFTGSLNPMIAFFISAFLLLCAFYPKMIPKIAPSFLSLVTQLRSWIK